MSVTKKTEVTVDGETHSIEDWIKFHPERNLTFPAVEMRIKKGMSPEDAVTIPRLWHRSDRNGMYKSVRRKESSMDKAKEELAIYEQRPEKPARYEWRFVPYTSHSGEWKKVKVK